MTTLNYAPLLTEQECIDALVGFITGIEGLTTHGVYTDTEGDDYLDGEDGNDTRCVVLFGREICEAANDAEGRIAA